MAAEALTVDEVRGVLDLPTLKLLNANNAWWILPLFAQHLEQAAGQVSAPYLQEKIAETLSQYPGIGGNLHPADYCRNWVNYQWLETSYADERRKQYKLSHSSLLALQIVRQAAAPGASVSGSRLSSIGDAVRRLADITNPDVSEQLARIDGQIAELRLRRRAVERGLGRAATTEEMRHQFNEVATLVASLPADFRRLSAMVEQQHHLVAAAMISPDITKGAMVERYLHEHDLLSRTSEGRAYRGFTDLLWSKQGDTISKDIEMILAQDFAQTQLRDSERLQLRSLMENLLAEDLVVTRSYTRWMASLRRFVSRSAGGRHHRLLSVVRETLEAGWESFRIRPGRAAVADVLRIGPLDVRDASQLQLWRPGGERSVELAQTVGSEPMSEQDREEMLIQAGTSSKAVIKTVNSVLESSVTGSVTGAEVFDATRDEHQRLAVLLTLLDLGLLHGQVDASITQSVELVTAAGARRRVTVPMVVFTSSVPVPAGRGRRP